MTEDRRQTGQRIQGGTKAMAHWRRSFGTRTALFGLAAGLTLLLAGDRGAMTATPDGIDPLEVLDVQVKNNVLFIFDTSGSMAFETTAAANTTLGGDDPLSRMYQAKKAVEAVIQENPTRMNYGFATYNVLTADKDIDDPNFDGTGGGDGPFIYVSDDPNADVFFGSQTCNDGGGTVDGYFCAGTNTFDNFNGTSSREVFRSFRNVGALDDPLPGGCTSGVDCRWYVYSKLFRANTRFLWNRSGDIDSTLVSTSSITCPLPPADLVGFNPDADDNGTADNPQPCIEFEDQATGNVVRFYYSSAVYTAAVGCGGAAVLNTVASCTGDNSQAILDWMRPELPVVSGTELEGNVLASSGADYRGTSTPVFGIRSAQGTPLADSLDDVRTAGTPVFPLADPAVADKQKNFVILLSDGDDTCANAGDQDGDGDSDDGDDRAIATARAAQGLYDAFYGLNGVTEDRQHGAETFFVAFTAGVNQARANKIGQAGSGGVVQSDGTVSCPAGFPCRNAFTATNTEDLVSVLTSALELVVASGDFSATPPVVSTVFELVQDDPLTVPANPGEDPFLTVESPLNPSTRYQQRVNIIYETTFDLPEWRGRVLAFRNDGTLQNVGATNFTGTWDAGETLFEWVHSHMESESRGGRNPNEFTFAELHAGESVDTIGEPTTPALIRRRIFTSAGNGRFVRTADDQFDSALPDGRNVVALWPPNQAGLSNSADVNPATGTPATVAPGISLDAALGIDTLTYDELLAAFGACEGSVDTGGPPAACDVVADPTLALDTARKEAREMILAWTAGAQVLRQTSDSKPARDASTGELLYSDRDWILMDSTYGSLAVVGPPFRVEPANHIGEFLLFRDGIIGPDGTPDATALSKGFGLRNPDLHAPNPRSDLDLKPVMTVVYVPANDMLHAFRAGPNCGATAAGAFDASTCDERGSEELWGYVPFDQLGKLQDLMTRPQTRDPHHYMVASSVRFGAVFLPDPSGVSGRWRHVILFGRGPGGKYYTAIDVTWPGPFTRLALETNPPWVLWSRGNPDTVDGTAAGTAVRAADTAAYAKMGQTWSTPAIANVRATPEWVAFTGSGYGDGLNASDEGTTFYSLDIENGDVVMARDVGDGVATFFVDNALVANPAAANPRQLDPPGVIEPDRDDHVTRVYVPDIHGRIWRFDTSSGGAYADEGPSQPFGVGVSLLKLSITDTFGSVNDHAYVFANSGYDNRVTTLPFRMFAYRDPEPIDSFSLVGAGIPVFSRDFPENYRGTSQPLTGFIDAANAVVFFLGTRFNPPTAACLSTFDTVLFGLLARDGGAAFDFDDDGTEDLGIEIENMRATGQVPLGSNIFIGSGVRPSPPASPTPTPTPTPTPGSIEDPFIIQSNLKPTGSPICRQ